MSELEQQIEEVELDIKTAEAAVDKMDTLLSLTNDPRYIKIIDEGYLKEEAIRLTHLRADYNFRDKEDQASLLVAIDSIGQLKQYLAGVIQMGRGAQNAIEQNEATRAELYAEDAAEDEDAA